MILRELLKVENTLDNLGKPESQQRGIPCDMHDQALNLHKSRSKEKEINLLDPIPYEPEIKELNEIEVVDESDDDHDDDSNENGQSQIKLEF